MVAVLLAVLVLGVPLAFAIRSVVMSDERSELQRLALSAAVTVSPAFSTGDPIELPASKGDVAVAVYDRSSRRVSGEGPSLLEPQMRSTFSGSSFSGGVESKLVVAAPVSSGEQVIAVVRAATPESAVRLRVAAWWAVLLAACCSAALLAGVVAARQSRRLAQPLVVLAGSARQLGDGDFSVLYEPSGVRETDEVGVALDRTARRLESLVERERSFAARASHQLRTPLTQLQLELESGLDADDKELRGAARAAMEIAERLSETIDDVLASVRASNSSERLDIEGLLEQMRTVWQGTLASQGRPLRVRVDGPLVASARLPAVRQILQVLLDNALKHGAGEVTLRARKTHGAVAVDVIDQGSAPPLSLRRSDARIGLPMALSLAESEGGRLLVSQGPGGTRFTVVLPLAHRERSA